MTEIGSVYGQALYDLAKSENLSEAIWQELHTLNHCFTMEEPDFIKLLSAPSLSKQERCQILDDSFRGKIQPYLLNFLKILTEKGYMRHFGDCCKAYHDYYNESHGILPVRVVTAVPMGPEQTEKLTAKLCAITGKTVELRCKVDPSLLGGVRLDYDGKQVDGTVKSRLDAVGKLLKNTQL